MGIKQRSDKRKKCAVLMRVINKAYMPIAEEQPVANTLGEKIIMRQV